MVIPPHIERLVIVCPTWVGDTVMATPLLRALRQVRPQARITAVCRPGLDELLDGLPWLNETIAVGMRGVSGVLRVARRLRRLRPQAVLLLPNTFRAALVARLGGVPVRIGYRRYGRGPLLTHGLAPPPSGQPVAAPAYYLRLGAFAVGPDLGSTDPRLELVVTDAQRDQARRLLQRVPRPFAVLCPGANRPAKRWPAARFASVADALAARHGLAVVVTGAPAESEVARAVANAATATIHDLVASGVEPGLGGLKGVVAEAALMITNDTGPRHIAAALGTPVVSLFGPTDPRWTTIDCPHERIVVANPFLPEPLVADRHPGDCVIDRISVGDVLAHARALLTSSAGPPRPAPARTRSAADPPAPDA